MRYEKVADFQREKMEIWPPKWPKTIIIEIIKNMQNKNGTSEFRLMPITSI